MHALFDYVVIKVKVPHLLLKITINEGGLKVCLGDIGREKSSPDLGFSQTEVARRPHQGAERSGPVYK